MSPREKGRSLRAVGWKSNAYRGVLGWIDPAHPWRGAVSTKEAYETETARVALAERNRLQYEAEQRQATTASGEPSLIAAMLDRD